MSADRPKRWWWWPAMGAGAGALWALGDYTYNGAVMARCRQWEATIDRDPDGVRQGCREFDLGAGDTAALMVHGFGDSPAIWRPLAERLAAADIFCRAIRLPHFCTPMEEYCRTDADQWLAAVRIAAADLRHRHRRVVIVAHSMGAAIAVNQVVAAPGTADALVLLAPLVRVCGKRSPLLSPAMWFYLAELTLHFTEVVETWWDAHLHTDAHARYLLTDRFVPRSEVRGLFRLVRENAGSAAKLHLPLLVFPVLDDPIVDTAATERFFRAAASKDKEMIVYGNVGHALPLETPLDDLAAEILRFLRRQRPA